MIPFKIIIKMITINIIDLMSNNNHYHNNIKPKIILEGIRFIKIR